MQWIPNVLLLSELINCARNSTFKLYWLKLLYVGMMGNVLAPHGVHHILPVHNFSFHLFCLFLSKGVGGEYVYLAAERAQQRKHGKYSLQ